MADMTTIARPYAKAAFAVAAAEGALTAWSNALHLAAATVTDERVRQLLGDPRVTPDQLTSFVADLTTESLSAQGRNFIAILAHNGRLDCLPQIAELFDALKDEAEGVTDVTVTSAISLSAQQSETIAQAMADRLKRQVRLHCKLDPSLLGGAVLQAGDLVIDGSVRGRLERIVHELTA